MLEVDDLSVTYQGFRLGPVSFRLDGGALLSLIGTNGSGKSTLIRAILGLNRVAGGTCRLDGMPTARRALASIGVIGYVSDSSRDVLGEFTAREYWNYCLLAYSRARGVSVSEGLERAEHFAELLDFPLAQRKPLSALSLGTSRKAQIIGALVSSPRLLILDEPFIGLDFIAARALEALLIELRDDGMTVIASSHDLDLASRIADQLVVLHDGRPIVNATVAEIGGHEHLEPTVRNGLAAVRRQSRRPVP